MVVATIEIFEILFIGGEDTANGEEMFVITIRNTYQKCGYSTFERLLSVMPSTTSCEPPSADFGTS